VALLLIPGSLRDENRALDLSFSNRLQSQIGIAQREIADLLSTPG
jgi:hypothetical protein